MSWKERYNFPTLDECIGKLFTLKPKNQIDLEEWDIEVFETHYGRIYRFYGFKTPYGYIRLKGVHNNDLWAMNYDFLKRNFKEVKNEIKLEIL